MKGHNYGGIPCKKCGKIHISTFLGHNFGICRKCGKMHVSPLKDKHPSPESIKKGVETRMKNGSYKLSEETRRKMTRVGKENFFCKYCNKEFIGYKSNNKKFCSLECYYKSRIGFSNFSEEDIKNLSNRMKDNNPMKDPSIKKKAVETLKKRYKNKEITSPLVNLWKNNNFRIIVVKRMKNGGALKARKGNITFPNKPESIIINLIKENNLPFNYTGDGVIWFRGETASFNPDFLSKNPKHIIEVFGDYWHKKYDRKDKERLETYAKYGYKTLVIWEHELKYLNQVLNKIKEFIR